MRKDQPEGSVKRRRSKKENKNKNQNNVSGACVCLPSVCFVFTPIICEEIRLCICVSLTSG